MRMIEAHGERTSPKLENIAFFRASSPAFQQQIAREAVELKAERRKVIILSGDTASRFYFIRAGWIKLYQETMDGTEAVIDILNAGHVFGDTALFHGDIYPYSAEAAEPAVLLSFPAAALKAEVESNPKFAVAMLSSMARYRRQQDQELEHRTLQNAPQRIGCFLLRLTRQDGAESAVIHLPYDKTLVASRLGMKPETFSRALAKLRADTGLEVQGSTITVRDVASLSHYACTACSSQYPCRDVIGS